MTITTTFPGQGGKNQVSRRALRVSTQVVESLKDLRTTRRRIKFFNSLHFYYDIDA
jgi:hypothetical protein